MRDGWRRGTFADLVELDITKVVVEQGSEYPIVGVLGFGRGLLRRDPVTVNSTRYQELHRVRPGQLVYSKLKAFEGAITVVPVDEAPAFASPEFPTFSCTDAALPSFVRLLTQQPKLWDDMAGMSKGVGGRRTRLHPADLPRVPVLVPPLVEQRRIVDLIGTLDDAVDAAERLAARLEATWWDLTKKLAEDASRFETALLSHIADIHGGLTKNKKDAERDDAVEVPYLRVANVHRRRLQLDKVTSIWAAQRRAEAALLQPGDLLMNEGGDRDKLGRGAVWRGEIERCTHQNHVFRVRVTSPDFVPEFVSNWANSFGQKWFEIHGAQTTGIASISKSTLSKFPVPRLDREDQQRWAVLLDAVTEREWEARTQVERLEAVRTNLLTVLLSGEHEIPESYDELLAG